MADKKPWLGPETFPTIWIWICFIFNIFGILVFMMLIVAEFVVLVNDYHNYTAQYGYHYPSRGYSGEAGCGYVGYTNAPKHLGSAVWMLLFQVSIIILATLVIASDLAWRTSSYNAWGGRWISAFYAGGITEGAMHPGLFFYVAANAFLKGFIVVLYMNQSFYGMRGNTSHESPFIDGYRTYTGSGSSSSGSGSNPFVTSSGSSASASSSSSSSSGSSYSSASASAGLGGSSSGTPAYSWKRGYDPAHPWKIYGVEAWVYLAGWIALCSIVPSMIAFLYLAPWGKKKKEDGGGGKEEKGDEKK
ncbi:hypothetical protein IAT38_002558 [Cryptococcus sp. DSM 104549]